MKTFSVMVLAAVLALVMASAASAENKAASAENKAASAENKAAFYVTPKIGFSSMTGKVEGESASRSVVPFGLAVGYDFNPVRVELEYVYRGKKEFGNGTQEDVPFYDSSGEVLLGYVDVAQKFKLGVQSFFLNGYYDIHNASSITPYVGLGLGLAKVSYEWTNVAYNIPGTGEDVPFDASGSQTKFAWNIGAGAAWQFSDSLALDLGYRYADFGKFTEKGQNERIWWESNEIKTSAHDVMLGLRFSF